MLTDLRKNQWNPISELRRIIAGNQQAIKLAKAAKEGNTHKELAQLHHKLCELRYTNKGNKAGVKAGLAGIFG
jgi:hypothetical protein